MNPYLAVMLSFATIAVGYIAWDWLMSQGSKYNDFPPGSGRWILLAIVLVFLGWQTV